MEASILPVLSLLLAWVLLCVVFPAPEGLGMVDDGAAQDEYVGRYVAPRFFLGCMPCFVASFWFPRTVSVCLACALAAAAAWRFVLWRQASKAKQLTTELQSIADELREVDAFLRTAPTRQQRRKCGTCCRTTKCACTQEQKEEI